MLGRTVGAALHGEATQLAQSSVLTKRTVLLQILNMLYLQVSGAKQVVVV